MNNKSLKEMYQELKRAQNPAQEFVCNIAEITQKSEATVRMWLSGSHYPDKLTQQVLSEKLGVDVKVLFPDNNNK